MLSKFIFITILVTVCYISSVESYDVIECKDDKEILSHLEQSPNQIVGLVITNKTEGFPAWIKNAFGNVVEKFLIVTNKKGSRNFRIINGWLYSRDNNYPTLYVVQQNLLLMRKLDNQEDISKMYDDVMNPDAEKSSLKLVTEQFKEMLAEYEARQNLGISGRIPQMDIDAQGVPPITLESNPVTDSQINDNTNRKKRKETGVGEFTQSSITIWSDTLSNDLHARRSSRSPPVESGSIRGRQSTSPPPTTGSSSRQRSRSPSATTGWSKPTGWPGGKRPQYMGWRV